MNNQAIIENMLDMWLSQKQLEKIKEGWNAFYNDPLKYDGTIVVDMIRLDVRVGYNHGKEKFKQLYYE